MDRRTRRTGRPVILVVLVVLVARSLHLLGLGRVVAPQRRAHSVKAVAQGLAYGLTEAEFDAAALSTRWLEEPVRGDAHERRPGYLSPIVQMPPCCNAGL